METYTGHVKQSLLRVLNCINLSDLSYLKLEVKRTIKSSSGDWENYEIKRWDGLKGEWGEDVD